MNRRLTIVVVLLLAGVLMCGCSRKGVHMTKHRKKRHCDCPTFSMHTFGEESTISYDEGGTI